MASVNGLSPITAPYQYRQALVPSTVQGSSYYTDDIMVYPQSKRKQSREWRINHRLFGGRDNGGLLLAE